MNEIERKAKERASYKKWYTANREAVRETRRRYYQRNRARLLAYQNEYNSRVRKGRRTAATLISQQGATTKTAGRVPVSLPRNRTKRKVA